MTLAHAKRRALAALFVALLAVGLGPIASTTTTDARAADRTIPVKAAFYYPWFPETENWATQFTPALGKYDSSNRTVLAGYLRVGGKPVLFVYNADDTTCAIVAKWKQAAPGFYLNMKVFPGYED